MYYKTLVAKDKTTTATPFAYKPYRLWPCYTVILKCFGGQQGAAEHLPDAVTIVTMLHFLPTTHGEME